MDEIIERFDLDASLVDKSLPLNWNIAPTNEIYIIRDNQQGRILDSASWGLIAPWQKNFIEARNSQSHAINARSESIHEKPTSAATQALSMTLIKCPGARIGKSEIPIAKQVSPGRTVMTENPTAPITSSAGCIITFILLHQQNVVRESAQFEFRGVLRFQTHLFQ